MYNTFICHCCATCYMLHVMYDTGATEHGLGWCCGGNFTFAGLPNMINMDHFGSTGRRARCPSSRHIEAERGKKRHTRLWNVMRRIMHCRQAPVAATAELKHVQGVQRRGELPAHANQPILQCLASLLNGAQPRRNVVAPHLYVV